MGVPGVAVGVPAGIQSSLQPLGTRVGSLESCLGFVESSLFAAAPQLPGVQQFGAWSEQSPAMNGCPTCPQSHRGFQASVFTISTGKSGIKCSVRKAGRSCSAAQQH